MDIQQKTEMLNAYPIEDFLQYMYQEFPSVYNNTHSRELLSNTVIYCIERESANPDKLVRTLKDIIPEVNYSEIAKYFGCKPN